MAGARLALVVANEDYADDGLRRLAAPGRDADALAEILGERSVGGFDVQVLRNESAQQIRFAIEDFFADRSPTDLLLVHFSCHGVKNASGELFLAAADTRPTRLASTAVAADFVNRQMADSRAQRIALFLDCCYGGAFPRGMVVRAAPAAQVRDSFAEQQDLGGGRGRVVVTASSAMQYAFEGDELAPDADVGTSVFTKALVDGLTTGDADRDGDGWVGLTELFSYVSEQVRQTIPQQTPQMWTFGAQGDMHIARSRFRRITPAALPPAVAEAIASPLSMVRYGAADELRDRLRGEDVRQALAAWHALSAMVEDDSRKVAESAETALAAAALRVSPEALELVAVGDHAEGELLLDGPPIALCATATSDEPWLHVEQDGSRVRVNAHVGGKQRLEGRLVLTGPISERLEVPVVVRAAGSLGKAESAPVPTPAPAPVAVGRAGAVPAVASVVERKEAREESAAPKRGLFDGPSLGRRGLLLLLVDLILLVLGGIIATTAGLDASVGVIPVAAAAVIITCLIMRRLPFALSAMLAIAAVALVCEALVLPRHEDYWNANENISGLPAFVVCAILFAALTLVVVLAYRSSPEDIRAGHDLRSTGIVLSVVIALAAMVSVSFVDLMVQAWCNQNGESSCQSYALGFEAPVLVAHVIPFVVVIVALLYATWSGRRRLASGAAVASAFLCVVTAAVDLAMFYTFPSDAGADVNRLVSYAVGALLVAAGVAGITAAKPSWVKALMTR
jgi:Caspase domain